MIGQRWGSLHFLQRNDRLRMPPPHFLQRWVLAWRSFFLRGRNGTSHLSLKIKSRTSRRTRRVRGLPA
jgi:hypothetical protein